ncbi:hypothetical protein IFM89_037237 [Coptis chinensis]|uniref:Myb/SANT-like domain-containing protein n=1 Tax=Coptis chinensis TaxID=261450 RepID=A0A835HB97_9MAGN|nr:hypothetical protein IFM89_037237 [Coptis chinensis]
MSKNYNVQYTQRQLKNQWDYLRKQYAAWRLLSKQTGHRVDFVRGAFEFPDEVWDDLIEKYPLTGQFRHAPLMNRDLLESLFEPTLASGDEMFNHKHPIPMTNPPNDDVAKDVPMDDTQYNPSHDIPYDNEESPTYVHNTPADRPPNQRQVPTTSRAKSDASSSQQKHKRDSIEPADPLVKSIGELVEMVKTETMGDKKLVDEGDAQVQELYVLGLLDDSLYLNSLEALSLHASHNKKLMNLQENRLKIQFLKNITSRMT